MKNRYWIMIFGAVLALCLVLMLLPKDNTPAQSAQITSGGKIIRTVDLSQDTEFTVEVEGGYNTITVRDGKIAVTEADCPDGYCKRQGFCNAGVQIVCLPHGLVISFLGETEIDGAVG